ncbi:hypothetical protein Tco_1249027 [Tanacetum coccineum]
MAATAAVSCCKALCFDSGAAPLRFAWIQMGYFHWRFGREPTNTVCSSLPGRTMHVMCFYKVKVVYDKHKATRITYEGPSLSNGGEKERWCCDTCVHAWFLIYTRSLWLVTEVLHVE